jgi:hypothetical protein
VLYFKKLNAQNADIPRNEIRIVVETAHSTEEQSATSPISAQQTIERLFIDILLYFGSSMDLSCDPQTCQLPKNHPSQQDLKGRQPQIDLVTRIEPFFLNHHPILGI